MTCPSCGKPVPEGARFCAYCGQRLQARADERRVATVVFADLVGFTTLSESRDPERVKNLVDGCFERLASDVTAFGGRVDKVLGDAIIALFGAPIAHEDDAERGVRAALQMQRTIDDWSTTSGVRARLRIGVNTGEVLVGALRTGSDYTAMGDVVNVASRLQTAAQPGEVLIGPLTHAAVRDVVRAEPLGPLTARGREEPVEAWRAIEAIGLPGYRPPRRRAPLVGRDAEISMLEGALRNAIDRRRPTVVLLTAEAGMGSSRLALELASLASASPDATVLEGRCLPYGEANVWWPVAEALRQACRIDPNDPADEAMAKCRTAVAGIASLDEDSPDAARLVDGLLYLMGYEGALADVDPVRARDEAVRSVQLCLEGIGRAGPAVLVLSDLHWADDLVLELIDRVLEGLRNTPVLVLATARPELEERWRPKTGRHNLIAINLEPLDRQASARLLASLLESEPSSELANALIERSGGNPFYLEELVSLLTETGSLPRSPVGDGHEAPELPETLRGLVAARLDALSPRDRSVLEDAAVAGSSGRVELLAALAAARGETDSQGPLGSLAARDLIVLDRRRWSFKSEVVREVAYATLTKAERARRHAALAMWLTERVKKTKREDEFLELVAHHYSQAAELASELGDVDGVPRDITALALEALERAASRAEWRELPVASHLLDHALRLVGSDDSPRRWRLLLRRASTRIEGVRDLAGARADAECVLREAAAAGDRGAEAGALTVIGEIQLKENDATGAVSTLERAAAMHQELDDRLGEAEALRALGMANQFLGHLDVAEDAIERALHAFEELGARRGEAWAFQNLAWIAFRRGRDDDAEARLLRSADMFVEVGDKGGIAWAFGLLGWVKLAKGLLDEAEKLAFEVLKGAEETGNRWGVAMMQALVAQVSLWQGRTERAVKKAKEAKRNFRELEDRWGEVQALVPLARGLVATGSIDDGLAVAQEALEVARCLDDPSMQFLARTLVTLLAVEIGDGSRALADGLEGVGADNYESLVGTDRLSALALALAQTDRAEEAVSRLEGYPADEEPRPARIAAVLAVAYACTGRTHEAVAAADDVARHDRKTYHDRLVAEIGAGLALARDGRASLSEERFDAAQAVVGPTEDRLSQALLMLARGRALEVLGSPGASDQIAEARTRLFAMGAGHDGWEAVFGQALGAQRV